MFIIKKVVSVIYKIRNIFRNFILVLKKIKIILKVRGRIGFKAMVNSKLFIIINQFLIDKDQFFIKSLVDRKSISYYVCIQFFILLLVFHMFCNFYCVEYKITGNMYRLFIVSIINLRFIILINLNIDFLKTHKKKLMKVGFEKGVYFFLSFVCIVFNFIIVLFIIFQTDGINLLNPFFVVGGVFLMVLNHWFRRRILF